MACNVVTQTLCIFVDIVFFGESLPERFVKLAGKVRFYKRMLQNI